jgi:alpha-tubulin suppressor-like RCC1 family protein
MSLLFRHFYDGDVDKFRALLAPPGYNAQSTPRHVNIGGGGGGAGGSPSGALGTSPRAAVKSRKSSAWNPGYGGSKHSSGMGKNEVNARDHMGLTVLLRAASSTNENAIEFVRVLLEHPAIDLYVQDWESGWNCLHRALYAGNISIARLLLEKERNNLTSHTVGTSVGKMGHLIKTKDNEGHSPFDLFNSTIGERDLSAPSDEEHRDDGSEADETPLYATDVAKSVSGLQDLIDGDELFAFGSNKNLSLGLGDQDDRQFPERVSLKRPDHLLQRFHREYLDKAGLDGPASLDIAKIPALVLSRPLIIRDVVLSKLHSAVLTGDPVSNLYVCGVGRGGRLGLGDENTRFNYAPVQGGLAEKRVAEIVLGQNHSMALTDDGELWTWGSNADSQLGYSLPPPARPDEEPMSTVPRQVFGPLKKERILGIAASAIHSVAHTGTSLFCWGKNVGQLALMDADSRSLEVQQTPRKVAASIFASPIVMVSAIDKATTCLLANHTVICFTAYGYNIVKFPFAEVFSNYHLSRSSMSSRYEAVRNQIQYITSGGDTIAAVTGRGDLFTFGLNHKADNNAAATSTTNPSKIKGAVTTPHLLWNARIQGVRSVGVGEHGSVIICTESGAVWRRIKRAKAKDAYVNGSSERKRSDFKFQRVPYISKIVTVRASPFGAFAAIRKDVDVMQKQIHVMGQTIWDNLRPLNPLQEFQSSEPPKNEKHWNDANFRDGLGIIPYEVLRSPDIESDLQKYLTTWSYMNEPLDMAIRSSSWPDHLVPVHGWLLAGRVPALLRALTHYREGTPLSERDAQVYDIEEVGEATVVTFHGLDMISILNLVQFLYEDAVIPGWNCVRQRPSWAFRYRQIRTELQKLATFLDMSAFEAAVRLQVDPKKVMDTDLNHAVKDPAFFDDGDALLELDDDEIPVHSTLVCQRCPWFQALFHGRSGGRWLAGRRQDLGVGDRVRIDLKHVDPATFKYVLEHIYSDTGEELFDAVVSPSQEDFEDLVMDVLSVANELMLDRLSQICQKIMGRFVNTRNVSPLLNEISPVAVPEFKDAGLEYICLQVETMLENHLLDDLDDNLLLDLDEVVRDNQLAQFPFARSGRAELLLHEKNPELAGDIDEERQRRVKEISFKATQKEEERRMSTALKGKYGSLDESNFPSPDPIRRFSKTGRNEPFSPDLRPKQSGNDLMFDMEDDEVSAVTASSKPRRDVTSPLDIDEVSDPAGTMAPNFSVSGPRTPVPSRTVPLMETPASQASPSIGGNPWKASPLTTAKLDLKQVFSAEPSNKQSALSASLATQKGKEATKQAQAKISQKERKKQQQAQAAEAALLAAAAQSRGPAWDKSTTEQSAPWKIASSKGKTTVVAQPSPANSFTPVTAVAKPKPLVAAEQSSASKPVSRRTASPDTRFSGQSRTPSNTAVPTSSKQPSRRGTPVTGSGTPPVSKPSSSTPTSQPVPPLVPHSKSYVPPKPKAEPLLGLSIADIMSQELAEQVSVKDAVAKRSLQEIQEEQAFQEWWDAESKRTQDEEARRNGGGSAAGGKKRSGGGEGRIRGRGRGGRGGKPGRGGARGPDTIANPSVRGGETMNPADNASHVVLARGGRGRGRGGGGVSSVAPAGNPAA